MAENTKDTKKTPPKKKRTPNAKKNSRAKGKKNNRSKNKNRLNLVLSIVFLAFCVALAVIVLPNDKEAKEPSTSVAKEQKPPIEKPQSKPQSDKTPVKTATQSEKSAKPAKPVQDKTSEQKKQVAEKPAPVKISKPATEAQKEVEVKKPSPQPFEIPPAKNNATLVLIIDDAGLSIENTRRYASLPFPLTIAVLPKLAQTKECAHLVHTLGKELILHQPMQSLNKNLNPGPGKISVDMSFAEISAIINENLDELGPFVKGLNNHEGSEVTEDVIRIGAVLDVCEARGIYFLDSRTTANTKAPQAALERDIKIFEKSGPYIDNVVDRTAMLKEIYKAIDVANKSGKAIIIGHVDKSAHILPQLLLDMYPYMIKAGYSFATPSMIGR